MTQAKLALNLQFQASRRGKEHTAVAPVQPFPPHWAHCGAVPEPPAAVVVELAADVVVDARLVVVDVPGADVGLTGVYTKLPRSESITWFKSSRKLLIYPTVKPNHLRSSSGNTSMECETPVPRKACENTATVS